MINASNVVVFDNRGIPSIMVKFERPQKDPVTPKTFIIGDMVVDAIYISKYPNTVINGRAYSLPMVDPAANITFNEAVEACRAKGSGWHLMTAVEWEYILNDSREKNTLPHGNTDWGKDYYHEEEKGEREGCGYGRTLTGSGPATWYHDHTVYGVSDLNGNVWEWLAGLRLMEGNIEHIQNNDAALHDIDLSRDSKAWQAVEINGHPARFTACDGEIKIVADDTQDEPDFDGVPWKDLQVELKEVPEALKDLGLVLDWDKRKEEIEKEAYIWIDTNGERLPLRGSSFNNTSHSGPSALLLHYPRSFSHGHVGFRSAFYEVNGKLITD